MENNKRNKILKANLFDYVITKFAIKKLYEKEHEEYLKEAKEYYEKIKNGEITDSDEIYEFYETHNIEPIEIIDKGNGCYTYIYNDGFIYDVDVLTKSLLGGKTAIELVYSPKK